MTKDVEAIVEAVVRSAVKQTVDAAVTTLGPNGLEVVDYNYDAVLGVITITFQGNKEQDAQR